MEKFAILQKILRIINGIFILSVAKIERVQEKFVKYALKSLGWTSPLNLPPYE
jgi:hypothetical protein